jgi:uncharacterized protein YecE (DUF72 family)
MVASRTKSARGPAKGSSPSQRRSAPPTLPTPLGEHLRIGPAGWSYPDWSGIVYPAHRPPGFHEASFLADFFDVIEINTSFYQPLRPQNCEQWLERTSANPRFRFTAKLWQKFTHEPPGGPEDEKAVRAGFDVLRAGQRLGAVLIQFPFSFHRTPENERYLAGLLERFGDYPLVVEVRHATWNVADFFAFLHERGVGFCNIDQPVIGKSIQPTGRVTAAIGYVRLHGRRYDTWFSDDPEQMSSDRYNYLYAPEELEPWAGRIRSLAAPHTTPHGTEQARDVYVITNNHFQGKGVVNALQLISLLKGQKVKVPETLRHHYSQLERIASEPAVEPTLFPMPPT